MSKLKNNYQKKHPYFTPNLKSKKVKAFFKSRHGAKDGFDSLFLAAE